MAPLHGTTTGGPPLGSRVRRTGNAAGRHSPENTGGPPLISNSNIPHGRPKWDTPHGGLGGASPYFRIVSVWSSPLGSKRTRHRRASPYFTIFSKILRGRPAWQRQGRGGPPLISELNWHIKVYPPHLGGGPGTGGPPLISELNRHIKVFPPCMGGGPGTRGPPLISIPLQHLKTPPPLVGRGPGTGGPPLISIQPFKYRTGGPPLISFQTSRRRCLRPAGANGQGRGASPYFTALPGEPDAEAAGRCHYPGAVSTVAAGAGPYLRPGAVSPLFHRLFLPVPSDRTRSPPLDAPVQNTRSSGPG